MYFVKEILINCPCIRNILPDSFWWRCLTLIKVFHSSKHYQMRWEDFFPLFIFPLGRLSTQQPRNSFKDNTRHSESWMSQTLSCHHPASPPTEGKVEKSNQILPQQKLMVTGDVSCFLLLFCPSMSSLCVWL